MKQDNQFHKCETCNEVIAKNAKTCPHCGAKKKKSMGALEWIGVTFLGLLMLSFFLSSYNEYVEQARATAEGDSQGMEGNDTNAAEASKAVDAVDAKPERETDRLARLTQELREALNKQFSLEDHAECLALYEATRDDTIDPKRASKWENTRKQIEHYINILYGPNSNEVSKWVDKYRRYYITLSTNGTASSSHELQEYLKTAAPFCDKLARTPLCQDRCPLPLLECNRVNEGATWSETCGIHRSA